MIFTPRQSEQLFFVKPNTFSVEPNNQQVQNPQKVKVQRLAILSFNRKKRFGKHGEKMQDSIFTFFGGRYDLRTVSLFTLK